jgi:hypothetical protein
VRPRLTTRQAEAQAKEDAFAKEESRSSKQQGSKTKPATPAKEPAEPQQPHQAGDFIEPTEDTSSTNNNVALRANKVAPIKRGDEVRRSARELRDQFENRFAQPPSQSSSDQVFAVPKGPGKAVVNRHHSFQQPKRPASEMLVKPARPVDDQDGVKKSVDAEMGDSKNNFHRQTSDRKSKTFGEFAR